MKHTPEPPYYGEAEPTPTPVAPARAPVFDPRGEKLFDITIVVGSVYADATSQRSPFQVAMQTISEHAEFATRPDAITYSFPNEEGESIEVTILNPPLRRQPRKD